MSEVDKYINILKSRLDQKKSEILSKINAEYEKTLKQRLEELEKLKENILKEVQK